MKNTSHIKDKINKMKRNKMKRHKLETIKPTSRQKFLALDESFKAIMTEEPEDKSTRTPMIDPFDTSMLGCGIPNYVLDPKGVTANYPPLVTPEQLIELDKAFEQIKKLEQMPISTTGYKYPPAKSNNEQSESVWHKGSGTSSGYDKNDDWIQTHSGRRFNPLNPNPDAIVIQDIAHSLSMQCRFSGHCSSFYSVAQHSVLVSYICDDAHKLWGLLHDASEAYLVDVPRPLKRSGQFQAYLDFEKEMQRAVCKRFALPFEEPHSVKRADTILLATEARDLMSPLHSDWKTLEQPLPFKIEAWNHHKAKDMFMMRFFEITGAPSAHYEHYLKNRKTL